MKTISLTLISLLALLVMNCTSSKESTATEKEILARLLEAKRAGRTFETIPQNNDTTIGYFFSEVLELTGTYQLINNYLVITIVENDPETSTFSVAVFAPDDAGQWTAVFPGEVVPGKLEKIIDLNGDQLPELIVDEYTDYSSGFESAQALYAKLNDGNAYERIDTLSRRWFGGSAFNNGGAEYTYETDGSTTKIIVHTRRAEMGDDGNAKETKGEYTLRWEPPNVIRVGAADISPALVDLAEATSELDSLTNKKRKAGLLTISYEERSEIHSRTNILYFDGSLKNLRFKEFEWVEEGGYMVTKSLEYNNGSVRRAMFQETERYEPAVFFYDREGQQHWIATGARVNTQKHVWEQILIADPPERLPDPKDTNNYFSVESATSDLMKVIRENASQFRPGPRYSFITHDQSVYSVDSLLWVREFANK